MHEAYHADWKKSGVRTSPSQQWQVELPLIVANRILGRVTVKADRTNRIPHHDVVLNLMKLTSDIENSILDAEQPDVEPAQVVIPESESVEPVPETAS